MDTPYGDMLHAYLLVSLRLLPGVAEHPHLAAPGGLRAGMPHHAAPRPDHAFPLGHVHERSRRE